MSSHNVTAIKQNSGLGEQGETMSYFLVFQERGEPPREKKISNNRSPSDGTPGSVRITVGDEV